jgi:hypothetical protein
MIVLLTRLPPLVENGRTRQRRVTAGHNPDGFAGRVHIGVTQLDARHALFLLKRIEIGLGFMTTQAGGDLMKREIGFVTLCLGLSSANLALADAIDGTWCAEKDSRQITIQGSSATFPGGQKVGGDYTRHSFAFQVPPPLANAGQKMDMRLLGETVLRAITISADGQTRSDPELWRRCEPTS